MPSVKTGTTNYYTQSGLPDKGSAKGSFVYNRLHDRPFGPAK